MSIISNKSANPQGAPVSHHRRIAIALLWIGIFVLVGRLVGAAKEMAIAWRFGISDTVDAYVFVFNLASWPVAVSFSVLTVVLLPTVAAARAENSSALPRFNSELFGLILLVGLILGAATLLGLPLLLKTGMLGLSGRALELALNLIHPLWIVIPLGMVISFFSAWMMACGFHRNTLLESIPALAILVAVMLPPHILSSPLVLGTLIGFTMNAAGLAWTLKRSGELYAPRLGFQSPAWEGFWKSIGIMAVGQVFITSTAVIDQVFAVGLGSGAISSLNYANRVVALILSLGGLAISRATLPIFSEVAAEGNQAGIKGLAFRWAWIMGLLGAGAAILAWLLAPWIVALLFQRGAFTAENTRQVAVVMQFYLIHIPFYFYALVMASALSSQKQYFPLMITGLIALLVKPASTFILIHKYGVNGVALSSAFLYFATSCYMVMFLRKLGTSPAEVPPLGRT